MTSDHDYFFKILILGDWKVGKSSLQNRFAGHTPNQSSPVFFPEEFKYATATVDKKRTKLQMWEPNGKARFRPVLANFFRGIQGVLLIYDVADKNSLMQEDSLTDIGYWLKQINKYGHENIVRILVGNKCDLRSQRQVSYQEGKEYADRLGIPFMEVSAQDGTNIQNALCSIAKELIARGQTLGNLNRTGERFNESEQASSRLSRKLMIIIGVLCTLFIVAVLVCKSSADSLDDL